MADNDVTITVDANNRTTAAFGDAARGARTVGEATQNANRSFREAENRYQQAALRLQQLAAQQRNAADRARNLARDIEAARFAAASMGDTSEATAERIRGMRRQQDEAARSARLLELQHRSSTEQVNDLGRAYRRAERNAQEALRASLMFGAGARLGPDGSVGAGGSGPGWFSRTLGRLTGGTFGAAGTAANGAGAATSNPIAGTAIVGAVLAGAMALAPLIGGAVTGAVGAGVGIGGVGLGVAGAIKNDPERFKKLWDGVIGDVTSRWLKASASWMEPVEGSIHDVDAALRRLPIESILSNSAGYLEPLTKGLTGFGVGVAGGLDSLVADVGPVIDMLGTRLPKLGADLGQFFAAIGKGSQGGAVALDDLLYVVGRLTKGLGVSLSALANMYKDIHDGVAGIHDLADAATNATANFMDGIPVLKNWADNVRDLIQTGSVDKGVVRFSGTAEAAEGFKRVEQSAEDAANAIEDYIDATQRMLDLAAGAKSASLALAEGWLTLNSELKDGKRTLDLNTQAGIDNQRALLDQVKAAEAARQSQLDLGTSVDSANAQFDANIERIRRMAYSLGFNKSQVDALIASLGVLAVSSAAPKVELQGAQLAMSQGIALGALLNNIAHTYTAKVQVVTGPGISLGNALHHAAGGATSGMSVVNDWGPGTGELIRTPDGSTVIPAGTGRAMMQNLAGGGGRQVIELQITSDGTAAANYALDTLANATRIRGNGSVQIAVMGRKAPV